MKLIEAAIKSAQKTAIIDESGAWTYQDLLHASCNYANILLNGQLDLNEERVAFMTHPSFDYVALQWSIWRAGGIAVPLCLTHPFPSLQYVIEDTEAAILIVSEEFSVIFKDYAQTHEIRFIVLPKESSQLLISTEDNTKWQLPPISSTRSAMILYTSGTTNKPKGVVLTHKNLEAQINNLLTAWEWSEWDHILSVLPLHHVHGIVNVVCCSLMAGATCTFIPSFSPELIFKIFLEGNINVFMAVPTIYHKLITHWEKLPSSERNLLKKAMASFRLMVSGSAALPVSTMEKWQSISEHVLLERYGMTEIGMAISNPYKGERRPGFVGLPLPNVEVRLTDDMYHDVGEGEQGEMIIRGDNVFKEYWRRPQETEKEFLPGGWFKTGDVAVKQNGYFKIVGRKSIDIIKSGGYKISALEIEETLRNNASVMDCAVVGIPDEEWGELVVAAIIANENFDEMKVNTWMKERLPSYKTPKRYIAMKDLPRNAMGKVIKNEVKKYFNNNQQL